MQQRDRISDLMDETLAQSGMLQRQSASLLEKNEKLNQLCDTSQKFLNHVSHEFRTPLCVVSQYASLIADGIVGEVNDEQTRMLRVMEGRVADLNQMVDDLLDISRHDAGMLTAKRRECTAESIVHQTLRGLPGRAMMSEVELRSAVDESWISVLPIKVSREQIDEATDPTQREVQAFLNYMLRSRDLLIPIGPDRFRY